MTACSLPSPLSGSMPGTGLRLGFREITAERRMSPTENDGATPPFWRHRYYYLALKIIVLVAAVYLALKFAGYY
jgi:hypothetical protein